MSILKITDNYYLKNGDRYWPTSLWDAVFIYNHGFKFLTIRALL